MGCLLEQNFEITETTTPPDDSSPNMSYAGVRTKEATTALTSESKPKDEAMQRRQSYNVPLRTPIIHQLPPKWAENEEQFAE